ncbi:MAG: COX15/CtaA family protein [Pseudomonadota bacterium]
MSTLYDYRPLVQMALLAVVLAAGPLAWVWVRSRGQTPTARLRALTFLTLFLTFDLIIFGAFTRLSDSGLGCPDWPGCYGSASPLGAAADIDAAQAVLPDGPVTPRKAWIEMIHRYLAATVGVLITVMTLMSVWQAWRREAALSPWWAIVTWVGVCLQGAFGAWTVTWKLYPLIVTGHLLGGLGLLVLLTAQSEAYGAKRLPLGTALRTGIAAVFGLTVVQVALGGWVSTNYAVLACTEFPTCQGSWWPAMDFANGFTPWRELGRTADGGFVSVPALTAIHMVHRWGAAVVLAALMALAWALWRRAAPSHRRWAQALVAVAVWQLLSGLSNVVLGWPLAAALAHTAGAAALLSLLTVLWCRGAPAYNRTLHG